MLQNRPRSVLIGQEVSPINTSKRATVGSHEHKIKRAGADSPQFGVLVFAYDQSEEGRYDNDRHPAPQSGRFSQRQCLAGRIHARIMHRADKLRQSRKLFSRGPIRRLNRQVYFCILLP